MTDPILASCILIAVFCCFTRNGLTNRDMHRYCLFQYNDAGITFRRRNVFYRTKNVLQPGQFCFIGGTVFRSFWRDYE